MKNKKGISLIVLVITIIVMVVLAGAIILTLNNSGIINKASYAVEKTNLKQVQQIASLAWAEAYADGVTSVEDVNGVKGLKTRIEEALEAQKIDLDDYEITVTDAGVNVILKVGGVTPPTPGEDEEPEPQKNLIPEGGTYTTGVVFVEGTEEDPPYVDKSAMVTYTAGQEFPATPQTLDRYVYGDYVYVYNATWNLQPNYDENVEYDNWWSASDYLGSYEGWIVAIATDLNKTSYGEILESINGKPVMSMEYTFYNCSSLENAPEIPSGVTNMYQTFYDCSNLADDDIVVPSEVTDMRNTFSGCRLLWTVTINANPQKYDGCFEYSQIERVLGNTTMKSELLSTRY